MVPDLSRRGFLQATAAAAAASAVAAKAAAAQEAETKPAKPPESGVRPVVVASGNGLRATARAGEMIAAGADPLEAVVAGVGLVEEDPADHTVGLGGLPNEEGVVELDAAVMHGPTHRGGAVAALQNIVHPSQVAKLVMERTDHVLLVGEGALRFAKAHGFPEQDLLTEESRRIWLDWRERRSGKDDWIPPPAVPDGLGAAVDPPYPFTYGTIHCCAVDAAGDLGAVTSTSGLSYKIPGRVGDSPIIGAGLYVDNAVGAAGATGRGEAVILDSGAFAIVELMRGGRSPQEACQEVLKRMVGHNKTKRLQISDGRPNFNVTLYALRKDGQFGSAALWAKKGEHIKFAVYSGGRNRLEESAILFEGPGLADG